MRFINAKFIKSASKKSEFIFDDLAQVAIVGRSNVGKSSLINTLTNNGKLAKTSSTPGRTRLVNYFNIDNKFYPINIPEICIHFLAISALSNIMRYQPEIWGSILSNDIDARLSTLIRYYLTIYEQKFPFLILRSISDYFPIIRERSI